MPWNCPDPACGTAVPFDDVLTCPTCGTTKEAWSLVEGQTRTLVVARSKKLEVRRGRRIETSDPSRLAPKGVSWVLTQEASVLPASLLQQLNEQGELPHPFDRLSVWIYPGKQKNWQLTVVVNFEKKAVAEHQFQFEPTPEKLNEKGYFEVQFVCARESPPFEGRLPFLHMLDVSDPTTLGHAPTLEVSGFRSQPISIKLGEPRGQGKKSVEVIELEDALFRTESAVVMPGGEDPQGTGGEPSAAPPSIISAVAACLRHLERHPHKLLLVTGHTDTTGADTYNLPLSEQRAACGLACLAGDRDGFVNVAEKRHLTADYQQILAWVAETFGFDCDPGGIDGVHGPNTTQALRRFQQAYNEHDHLGNPDSAPLAVDGILGAKTWAALFDAYEAALANELGTDRAGLGQQRGGLLFVDPARRSVGCGESHPIEGLGQDEFRSQTNRRVEILLFDPGEEPTLSCHAGGHEPGACELYEPGCYERRHLPVGLGLITDWTFELETGPQGTVSITALRLESEQGGYDETVTTAQAVQAEPLVLAYTFPDGPDGVFDLFASSGAEEFLVTRALHVVGGTVVDEPEPQVVVIDEEPGEVALEFCCPEEESP